MNIQSVYYNLELLLSVLNIEESLKDVELEYPYAYSLLKNIGDTQNSFVSEADNSRDLIFSISGYFENIFIIKEEDREKEDPPLYYLNKKKTELFFDSSSIVLLTEFALWKYKNANFTFARRKFITEMFHILRQNNFFVSCGDSEFPNEIWVNPEGTCFAISINYDQEALVVTKNEKVLLELKSLLGIDQPVNYTIKDFKSDIVIDGKVIDNILYGYINFSGIGLVLSIFDPETESASTKVLKNLITRYQSMFKQLDQQKVNFFKEEITKSILSDAYSQSEQDYTTVEYQDLFDSLKLVRVEFNNEAETAIIFSALYHLPERDIIIYTDDSLAILGIETLDAVDLPNAIISRNN